MFHTITQSDLKILRSKYKQISKYVYVRDGIKIQFNKDFTAVRKAQDIPETKKLISYFHLTKKQQKVLDKIRYVLDGVKIQNKSQTT